MSWCDKLASTPSVGLRLDPRYNEVGDLINGLSPVLNKLVKGDKPTFTINNQDSFAVEFITDDGYRYGLDPSKIFVEFQHRMRIEPVSGGAPVANLLTKALPYTSLLPEVIGRAIEAVSLTNQDASRNIKRIGIVSTTLVADDEAPPGISRLVKYFGRPWNGTLDFFNYHVMAELNKTDGYTDRCYYVLNRPEDRDQLFTMKFDWQRVFTEEQKVTPEVLKKLFAQAQTEALNHFEELAEGNQFDEAIINAK